MPTLYVENIPDELYKALRERAQKKPKVNRRRGSHLAPGECAKRGRVKRSAELCAQDGPLTFSVAFGFWTVSFC